MADSAGPGFGSTFAVRLPVVGHAWENVQESRKGPASSGLRIVAIDDNKDALDILSLLLAAHHHEVTLAHDGISGIETVKSIRPDVVICDIGLPGRMNGYDVVRAIRDEKDLAETLVIALSGYGQESDKQKSAAGFDIHLVKPVRHQELEEVLKRSRPKAAARSIP